MDVRQFNADDAKLRDALYDCIYSYIYEKCGDMDQSYIEIALDNLSSTFLQVNDVSEDVVYHVHKLLDEYKGGSL